MGLLLVLIYLGLKLFRRDPLDLPEIIETVLDGFMIISAARLLIKGIQSKRRELGVFSELRVAIVLGAVAMLYVAIGSLLKLIAG